MSRPEKEKLHRAEQLLLRDCMRKHGFETWPTSLESPVADDVDFPYAITDIGWARRHGYGSDIQDRIDRLKRADPNQRYFERLSAKQRTAAVTALNGARPVGLEAKLPTGGVVRRSDSSCVSEADRRLYGDLKRWYRAKKVTDNLGGLRVTEVMRDKRFKEAVKRWSACMRERGYAYSSPGDARGAALKASTGEKGRKKEIRTAVAEATCASGTGLTATIRRLDGQYGKSVNERYRPDVTARRDLERAALPRATEVISAH